MNAPLSANNTIVQPVRSKGEIVIRNAKSLLGMPVIADGETLGRVSCVQTDDTLREIRGLFLSCGLSGTRFVERRQVDLIGDIAVLIHGSGRRMAMDRPPLLRRAYSPDGRRIGAITDAVIDEKSLLVAALELSYGYLDDLTGGRVRVSQFSVRKNGDVVVEHAEGGNLS